MKLILTSLICCFISIAQAQTKLIEKIEKKPGELRIPYQRYQLANGLTLLIHEDHSDPIVHVDVTYHVGSAREQLGRSGFAHFFEHMMFQGSEHVADEEHFKIVSEAGGTLNGTTNTDRTNYFETMPSNHLETALWLESDRMGFLLDAVTQQKFEVQRSTVKNERGQNYDNRPYGLAGEKTNQALFPLGHPYSWPTIGYIEDLNRVDVNDLKKFFMRWYGPNNAVLTVAGDVDPKKVIELTEKYFSSIKRGPEVNPQPKNFTPIDANRYISFEDNIRFPMIRMSFPGVHSYHADEAPMDVLADVLGGGKSSIMYKNLIKTEKAMQCMASNPALELGGSFTFTALAMPGISLKEMEELIRQSMTEFEKTGITEDQLKKFKATKEAEMLSGIESVGGKAGMLASYFTFLNNPDYIQKDLDRYNKVTAADVMRVYEKYIKGKPAVILSIVPKGKTDLVAAADNFKPVLPQPGSEESDEYKNLVANKPVDNFDRSKKPVVGPVSPVKVPSIWSDQRKNGLRVSGTENKETETTTLLISIPAGHFYEPKDKSGLANIVAEMMMEGTKSLSAEQLSDKIESLGSSIDVESRNFDFNISITSLTKNLDSTLYLVKEIMFNPAFKEEEFERVKKQILQAISNQLTQPTIIAENAYNKLMFGESILGIPAIGNTATVGTITLDDVKNYYSNYIIPTNAGMVAVSNLTSKDMMSKTAFLEDWKKKTPQPVPSLSPAIFDKTKIYVVNKDNAAQSMIKVGYVSMPYDATGEHFKSNLMNYNFAGAFNGRLNLKLREEKGYTYGAGGKFDGSKYHGLYTAQAGVRANITDSALLDLMTIMKNYAQGTITKEELDFMKQSVGQSDALKYETPAQKALFIKRIMDYNLPKDYTVKQSEIINNMTLDEINELAKKNLPVDKMAIVVVGDKKNILPGLEKLGYEIIEIDMDGKRIVKEDERLIYPGK